VTAEVWGVIIVFALIGYWLIGFVFEKLKRPPRAAPNTARPNPFDAAGNARRAWYDVLEVAPDASIEQIEYAYRRLVAQYHPDKVATLGPELRALAERMTAELNVAYDAARKARA
jgi:DnaJ-domain-containing protein 1